MSDYVHLEDEANIHNYLDEDQNEPIRLPKMRYRRQVGNLDNVVPIRSGLAQNQEPPTTEPEPEAPEQPPVMILIRRPVSTMPLVIGGGLMFFAWMFGRQQTRLDAMYDLAEEHGVAPSTPGEQPRTMDAAPDEGEEEEVQA